MNGLIDWNRSTWFIKTAVAPVALRLVAAIELNLVSAPKSGGDADADQSNGDDCLNQREAADASAPLSYMTFIENHSKRKSNSHAKITARPHSPELSRTTRPLWKMGLGFVPFAEARRRQSIPLGRASHMPRSRIRGLPAAKEVL